jgi:excinuclease UvrABC ATPase subunit
MNHKRNTTGLARAAKERREETAKRVESAIKLLVKEKKAINFNSISKIANVGKPWLYKEDAVRKQIEHLRDKTRFIDDHVQTYSSNKATKKSKEHIIQMLKDRVHKLEDENKKLHEQVETLYGQFYTKEAIK